VNTLHINIVEHELDWLQSVGFDGVFLLSGFELFGELVEFGLELLEFGLVLGILCG
jgi:hypothetical protein